MSAARKDLPKPSGVSDIAAAMRTRYTPPLDEDATPAAGQSARGASRTTSRTSTSSATGASTAAAKPEMDRRSWYMPATSAAQLTALVDDLHFATRRPKHEVLAAVVRFAADHQDAIRALLGEESSHS